MSFEIYKIKNIREINSSFYRKELIFMKTLNELKVWMRECGYACKELSEDQLRYFMDSHRVFNKGEYDGKVCKFTGKIYGLLNLHCDQYVGYLTEYKTSSGRKVFNQHRL